MKTEVTENVFEEAWAGFKGLDWKEKASISRFVKDNHKNYVE